MSTRVEESEMSAAAVIGAAKAAERSDSSDIVFFDGVCNLCNGVVQFILDRDPRGEIQFAALQSSAASDILSGLGVTVRADEPDSVIFVTTRDGARVAYDRSDAVLRIARKLSFPWPIFFYAGMLVPRALRDLFYKVVARHRYGWFGKSETCRVPTPELRKRFLS